MADAPPPLHVVTDDAVVAAADFVARARAVLEAGGRAVALHLRAPGATGRVLQHLAEALGPAADDAGAWLIVNDRLDVALAARARGVQLGARGLPLADVRAVAGAALGIGASVHSVEEARIAAGQGTDWLVFGNVYETASHPGRPGAGLDALREAAAGPVPVIAIGGVTAGRAGELRAAGAAGIAVLRAVWDAADPADAVRELEEAWRR